MWKHHKLLDINYYMNYYFKYCCSTIFSSGFHLPMYSFTTESGLSFTKLYIWQSCLSQNLLFRKPFVCGTQMIWVCVVSPMLQQQSGISSQLHATNDSENSTCDVVSGAEHAVPMEQQGASACRMVVVFPRTPLDAPKPPYHVSACVAAFLLKMAEKAYLELH